MKYAVTALLAAFGLTACQQSTGTPGQISAQASYGHDVPVDAPVAFVGTELRGGFNRLGGEVPMRLPTQPVDEGGLGEPGAR